MDWINLIEVLGGIVLGGGLTAILTAKTTVKKGEFELWKSQIDSLNSLLAAERERNKELMAENIARAKDKDKLRAAKDSEIEDKVKRLRETQEREYAANCKVVETQTLLLNETKAHEALKRNYDRHRCHNTDCPHREPPTEESQRAKEKLKTDKKQ